MAENPLLPHRRLKELHALMLRCRDLERKQRGTRKKALPAREALLAATSMHLMPGDLLCAASGDFTAHQLAPKPKIKGAAPHVAAAPTIPSMALAAATARGLQAAGEKSIVLAYTAIGVVEPAWEDVLTWAHHNQLPLILACTDFFGPRSARSSKPPAKNVLNASTVERLSKRTKLPVLTVDGEDAVAVYRVMQESVIRARMGGGPAILWAMMTPVSSSLPRAQQPLARLESYLSVRGIKPAR